MFFTNPLQSLQLQYLFCSHKINSECTLQNRDKSVPHKQNCLMITTVNFFTSCTCTTAGNGCLSLVHLQGFYELIQKAFQIRHFHQIMTSKKEARQVMSVVQTKMIIPLISKQGQWTKECIQNISCRCLSQILIAHQILYKKDICSSNLQFLMKVLGLPKNLILFKSVLR